MRILVLTKRQYTGRDLLDDRFGRLFEIPEKLAAMGHEVRGLTCSYRPRPEGITQHGRVTWRSFNATLLRGGTLRHLREIRQEIRVFQPDLVWASSDMWHAIACRRVCQEMGVPYVLDLYDNYESFLLSKIPGVRHCFKKACREADGVTSISTPLSTYLERDYGVSVNRILTLGNATNPNEFFPADRQTARKKLNLEGSEFLIGTAGALGRSRGTSVLLRALPLIRQRFPQLQLVLAGPHDGSLPLTSTQGLRYLGVLPPDAVPAFYNAMDVSLICNRPSSFGSYCYPQKLNEILACETRLLAANVGGLGEQLADQPSHLFSPDDEVDLAAKLCDLITRPCRRPIQPIYWQQRANELSSFIDSRLSAARVI
ncbi:glycosyltransferase family 4 protein [Pseudomonas sp. HS-18]|uniref:glycosyltransferase family 4 protein n=1 Tax=Pseudomonas sp. HS-18 TaxID=2879114 RepID=UPI001CEFBEEA|nr:glycosyltransferase family 4 protein [Pseudomonas sp. HS-18]UCL88106.1 glycosyltransferase family 4 protein [Pseudomonas sp. HS-18]